MWGAHLRNTSSVSWVGLLPFRGLCYQVCQQALTRSKSHTSDLTAAQPTFDFGHIAEPSHGKAVVLAVQSARNAAPYAGLPHSWRPHLHNPT